MLANDMRFGDNFPNFQRLSVLHQIARTRRQVVHVAAHHPDGARTVGRAADVPLAIPLLIRLEAVKPDFPTKIRCDILGRLFRATARHRLEHGQCLSLFDRLSQAHGHLGIIRQIVLIGFAIRDFNFQDAIPGGHRHDIPMTGSEFPGG